SAASPPTASPTPPSRAGARRTSAGSIPANSARTVSAAPCRRGSGCRQRRSRVNLTAVFTNLLGLVQAAGLVIGALGLAIGAALYALYGGNPHRKQTGLDAMIAGVIGGAVI